MKTSLIISSLLVLALGIYQSNLSDPDQHESAVKTAVAAVSVSEPVSPDVEPGQFDGNGEYLEVRKAAASAAGGDQATLAWRVDKGSYRGVPLNGLAVVAVVFGDGSIGIDRQTSTRTTLLVDARADESQQAALVDMAKAFAGDTIQQVVAVRPVKIEMNVCRGCSAGYASLKADTTTVRTRRVLESDEANGTPQTARPTLARAYFQYPAVPLEHSYSGPDYDGHQVQLSGTELCSTAVGGF